MKLFRICIVMYVIACSATIALGQYGLYGSPDTLNMTQQTQTPSMVPYGGYSTPSNAYTTASQPTSYGAYGTQQAQTLPSRPVTTYTSAGSQYIAPPQYSTPTPAPYSPPAYTRPTYYTAYAGQAGSAQPGTMQTIQSVPTPSPQFPVMKSQNVPTAAPGIQQTPGVMNQMLAEQGQAGNGGGACVGNFSTDNYVPYGGQCGAYQPLVNHYQQQAACGNCDFNCAPQPCMWYGSVSALVMTRDRPNKVYITYETGNLPHNDFPDDQIGWSWGGEVRLGRRFGCGGCNNDCNSCCNQGYWSLEATYWTLADFRSSVTHTSPVSATNPNGTVGTPLNVSYNEFPDPDNPGSYRNAEDWFDGAGQHRLVRRDEFHDVEINVVRGQWTYGQDSRWDVGWSMGVRYFRFQEGWQFGTLMNGATWDQNSGGYAAYMNDQITNNLIGPQLGFELGYNMGCRLRFYLSPKFGIYDNNIENHYNMVLGNSQESRPTAASGMTGTYPVDSSMNTISFLTQIDAGLDWQFASQWSARVGYRVVAATGIGLADAQIPFYTVDIPAIAAIDRNGDLLLHGAYISLGYSF